MSFEIVKNNYLEFKLTNNFNPNINQDRKQGIGIKNAERRLNLLFFNDYILRTKIIKNTYNLFLKIPIR